MKFSAKCSSPFKKWNDFKIAKFLHIKFIKTIVFVTSCNILFESWGKEFLDLVTKQDSKNDSIKGDKKHHHGHPQPSGIVTSTSIQFSLRSICFYRKILG